MNELPRQKLIEIVARYGREVVNNPRRCEGLLRDYAPKYRREIAVLVVALDERVPAELLAYKSGAVPRSALLLRMAQRLHDDVALEETAARWAVESWALALSLINADELAKIERPSAVSALKSETSVTKNNPLAINKNSTPNVTPPSHSAAQPKRVSSTKSQAGRPTGGVAAVTPQASINPNARDTIIVSAAGDGEFLSIAEALRHASPNARVLVRPGLYRESITIDNQIEIVGDGALESIIIESTDASCLSMHADAATVRNLTLRGISSGVSGGIGFFTVDVPQGELTLEDCDITSESFSSIALHNSATTSIIRRCHIHDSADSGIYAYAGARGRVEDCLIHASHNLGVAVTDGAVLTLARSVIRDGDDAGVVVWNKADCALEECEITGNSKAGLGVSDAGEVTARGCRFHRGDNSGIFVHRAGRAALEDCDISGHAEAEAAITTGGNLTLRGCHLHHGQMSGVYVREDGRVLIEDCDVYANREAGVSIRVGGVAAIRRSRINGNGTVAVEVETGGAVDAEDNDLTNNRIAAWETNYDALVESRGNKL